MLTHRSVFDCSMDLKGRNQCTRCYELRETGSNRFLLLPVVLILRSTIILCVFDGLRAVADFGEDYL